MATRKFLYVNSSGLPQEAATTDDVQLQAVGIGGAAPATGIDMNSSKMINLTDPTAAQDGATKAYVDSVAQGLDVKGSCRFATTAALAANTQAGTGAGATLTANANGALSVDGSAVVATNRILVKNEAAGANNGIYTVTATGGAGAPFILTRATDADGSATGPMDSGMFTFIEEGTAGADTGWVLTTNNPITVDTTALVFTQFSGAGTYTGGNGVAITGMSIAVDTAAANGMTFNAGKLEILPVAAGAGVGGLELTASGLQMNLKDASLALDASGLAASLSGTTLELNAGVGLRVKGLPSLFEIAGVATGATVSAANLDTITDASNADAMHSHALVQGPAVTIEGIGAGEAVAWSATNNKVQYGAANTDSRVDVIGVTTNGAALGGTLNLVRAGIAASVLVGATAGDRYYIPAAGGALVAGIGTLATGDNIVLVGTAVNATDLEVRIQYIGKKA